MGKLDGRKLPGNICAYFNSQVKSFDAIQRLVRTRRTSRAAVRPGKTVTRVPRSIVRFHRKIHGSVVAFYALRTHDVY